MKKGNIMKNYIVKQIVVPEAEKDYPNQYGWGGAEERSPAWKAKLNYMHGLRKGDFNSSDLALYEDTYEVQANGLEDVFRITNLWDDPDAVHSFRVGHSTSVGDIVVDKETNEMFMVDSFGFKKVA